MMEKLISSTPSPYSDAQTNTVFDKSETYYDNLLSLLDKQRHIMQMQVEFSPKETWLLQKKVDNALKIATHYADVLCDNYQQLTPNQKWRLKTTSFSILNSVLWFQYSARFHITDTKTKDEVLLELDPEKISFRSYLFTKIRNGSRINESIFG